MVKCKIIILLTVAKGMKIEIKKIIVEQEVVKRTTIVRRMMVRGMTTKKEANYFIKTVRMVLIIQSTR